MRRARVSTGLAFFAAQAVACADTTDHAACDDAADAAPDAPARVTVHDPRWGELTDLGPRVSGAHHGRETIVASDGASVTGEVYDADGDGRDDEIDLDGDGIADGEDVDGDGVMSIWSHAILGDDATTLADLAAVAQAPTPEDEVYFAAFAPLADEAMDLSSRYGAAPVGGVSARDGAIATGKGGFGVLAPRDQGPTGTSVSFAVGAALALMTWRVQGVATPPATWPSLMELSRQVTRRAGVACVDATVPAALDVVLLRGVGADAFDPYPLPVSEDPVLYCLPPGASPPPAGASSIHGYEALDTSTRAAWRAQVRRYLAQGWPVVIATTLPAGFGAFRATARDPASGLPTDVTRPFSGGGECAGAGGCPGHALVIVDYDDARGAYRVLNSWGSDWGDGGYLWWDYDALEAANRRTASGVPLAFVVHGIGAAWVMPGWFVRAGVVDADTLQGHLRVGPSRTAPRASALCGGAPTCQSFQLAMDWDTPVSFADRPIEVVTGGGERGTTTLGGGWVGQTSVEIGIPGSGAQPFTGSFTVTVSPVTVSGVTLTRTIAYP